MPDDIYAIRPMVAGDIPDIVAYHRQLNGRYGRMLGLGADAQIPDFEKLEASLHKLVATPFNERKQKIDILLLNDRPVGHAALRNIQPGETGEMHFHIWRGGMKGKGLSSMLAVGRGLAKAAMRFYFETYDLRLIIGEPHAHNPLPNRALRGMGLLPIKTYVTMPGPLIGTVLANRYEIPRGYFPDLA